MRISAMWRAIVPWHPATAWALSASLITFVSTTIAHGLHSGFRGGMAVFLAWAITRELAPKKALASALAPFAGIAFAIPAQTDLLSCAGVLAVARVTSRSIGDPPTLFDRVGLVALTSFIALRQAGLPVTLVLAAVCFADLPRARARVTGIAILVTALLVGATEGTLTMRYTWDDPTMAEQVLIALTAAVTVWLLIAPLPTRLRTRDDRKRGPLLGARIRITRLAVLACIVAGIAWTGTDAIFMLSSASAALLAAGLGGARLPAARSARPEPVAATGR